MPMPLKLHRCFGHGLKIRMWFGYNPEIYFLSLFPQVELSNFLGVFTIIVTRQWVPCVRNSSYSFMPIPLKLHRCFDHCLKICMWFGYNPEIIFYYFFRKLNLAIFHTFLLSKWIDSWYLVCATPPTVLCQFLWNFTGVLIMVWRYACGLDIILTLFFYYFFHIFNLAAFPAQTLKCIYSGDLVSKAGDINSSNLLLDKFAFQHSGVKFKVTAAIFRKTLSSLKCLHLWTDFFYVPVTIVCLPSDHLSIFLSHFVV